MRKLHKKMRVMVFGVFDGLHEGHRAFLAAARGQGSELTAIVARDSFVRAFKKKTPARDERRRLHAVQKFSAVDTAELADEIAGSYGVIKKFKPDIIAVGYDQDALAQDLRRRMRIGALVHILIVRIRKYEDMREPLKEVSIPAEARRVFRGVIFDVYHWKQKMFDGTYEIFERLERRPTVDVIATRGSKILVLHQQQPARVPYRSLSGGGIHEGEAPISAALRELREETGTMSDDWYFMGEYFGSAKIRFHEYEYVARNVKKVARQHLDSGEKIKVGWMTFDEFLQCGRDPMFAISAYLKFRIYEALADLKKKEELRREIFFR